jgi:hypothetical protein
MFGQKTTGKSHRRSDVNGKYEIHFHEEGKERVDMVFEDFDSLERYIMTNKTADWERRVNVHLPAYATDQDRVRIVELGFQSN